MGCRKTIAFFLPLFFTFPLVGKAYSVLTHMAVIDECWTSIQPLLLKKYPNSTTKQLKEARAYVYGGAIVPDMGYYPFGTPFFTNLVHYVRTGDFVLNMINEASNLNEYAFSIGSLAHYYSDILGHSVAVNPSVPLVYDKMKEKFGDTVYYAENKVSHTRMEFGIDVLQVAKANYAPANYHDFIGFKVSKPVLERAFKKTYGIEMKDIFKSLPLAIGTFRWTVKNFFPVITKIAWANKRSEINKINPKANKQSYVYHMSRKEYYGNKEEKDNKPGFFSTTLSWAIKFIPKFGPTRAFKFKVPTPEAEKLFFKSFDLVVKNYSATLKKVQSNNFSLADTDFDTGHKTAANEYTLADETYNKWLLKLSRNEYENITPALRRNVMSFYSKPNEDLSKRSERKQRKIKAALNQLSETSFAAGKAH